MLILAVSEDLNELFQNCSLASITALGELCGVVVMAIDLAIMLVVAILCTENGRTHGASEMLDVILSIECRDI